MAGPRVQINAARTDRSLVPTDAPKRRQTANPVLKFWRWMINSAVAGAKRTRHGLPTHAALLERWWIEEHKPAEADREEWMRSFAACCSWLNLDEAAERARLLAAIDEAWREASATWLQQQVYLRRAQVLTCAGVRFQGAAPVAIARQYQLPLVSDADYEQVAGVEHGDPPGAFSRFVGMRAA